MLCGKIGVFRFVIVMFVACFFVSQTQGCALYRAMSGEDDSADVSSDEDVSVLLDSDYPVEDVSRYYEDVEESPDAYWGLDAELDVSQEKLDCVNKCIGGCVGPGPDQCNDYVHSISLGHYHGCAVSQKREVHCWGNNEFKQLGVDQNDASRAFDRPVKVQGVTGAMLIAAGRRHSCSFVYNDAADKNEVWCWGDDTMGQINGEFDRNAEELKLLQPTLVPFPQQYANGIRSLHAGIYHTCADVFDSNLPGERSVMCWGDPNYQIYIYRGGGMENSDQFKPASIHIERYTLGYLVPAGMVASKYYHACAIGNVDGRPAGSLYYDNALWCWGENYYGQLEMEDNWYEDLDDEGKVVSVASWESRGVKLDPFKEWVVGTGSNHTCLAERFSNEVKCWGGFFQPVDASSHCVSEHLEFLYKQSDFYPGHNGVSKDFKEVCTISFDPDKQGVSEIIAGDGVSCVRLGNGEIECLGADRNGVLTRRTLKGREGEGIIKMELGSGFACALFEDSSVWCWGKNEVSMADAEIADWTEWSDHEMFEIKFH